MAEFSLLRRAARELTPASLRSSLAGPRLQTSIDSVTQRRKTALVTVSPLGQPLAVGTHAQLDFRLGGQAYVVSGVVDELYERGARLSVRR